MFHCGPWNVLTGRCSPQYTHGWFCSLHSGTWKQWTHSDQTRWQPKENRGGETDRDELGTKRVWEHSWITNTGIKHHLPRLTKSSGSAGCSGCWAACFWICCYIRALLWWNLFTCSSRQQHPLTFIKWTLGRAGMALPTPCAPNE